MTSPTDLTVHDTGTGPLRDRADRLLGGVNVGAAERILSGAAGVALVTFALRRRRLRGLLIPLGGELLWRAVTGRCPLNRALGRNSALPRGGRQSALTSVERGEGVRVEEEVIVDRPASELYRFWRNFQNLPQIMEHLESVTVLDDRRSRWTAKAPAGSRVEWEAEIHNEIPNELIAWRSLPGADVDNAGSVHFRPLGDGRTEVRVILRYDPPAGRLGAAIAKLFGEAPSQQVSADLRRFKEVMEGRTADAGAPSRELGTTGYGATGNASNGIA
jgi:uncharacterized membrane protein